MLRSGPLIVGEFRGGKAETAKRFDKSDKNAAPIEFGMFKFTIELLSETLAAQEPAKAADADWF